MRYLKWTHLKQLLIANHRQAFSSGGEHDDNVAVSEEGTVEATTTKLIHNDIKQFKLLIKNI